MAKINCRTCDICGVQMDAYDMQYWLRAPFVPILRSGAPVMDMKRVDVCDKCMFEIIECVQKKVKRGMDGDPHA